MATFKGTSTEGNRALSLSKQRELQKEEFERQKQLISKEAEHRVASISNKFASKADAVEDLLKSETVGLVTLDDFTAKREKLQLEREKQLAAAAAKLAEEKNKGKEALTAKKKTPKAALSFSMDDEEEEEGGEGSETEGSLAIKRQADDETSTVQEGKKLKLMKNPEVDTSFLPDREREERERQEREALRQEWVAQQEKIKNEEIEIVYSYWDGSGHRRTTKVKKGYTIEKFLEVVLESLKKEFPELRTVSVDGLMYIKEDLIIPHHSSFYDFIVTKARGKSGPLFDFDVREDIRMIHDATVEKQESHAGKILLRSWYERHKHIFPANRWEPYDPEKKWDKYTIK